MCMDLVPCSFIKEIAVIEVHVWTQEFDPEEFYKQLEFVEDIAKQTIKTDIPRYIVSKLGLARDHQIGEWYSPSWFI
jgi:hypothetical protein